MAVVMMTALARLPVLRSRPARAAAGGYPVSWVGPGRGVAMLSAATPDVASAAALLRALLGDRLHEPGAPGYAATTRLWNGAVACTPALVAQCRDADEVAESVRVAARCHLPVSVRSAGHDWAGRALRDGALALDLTGLRSVRVDPDAATVTIGGGATAAELLAAARPYDLVGPHPAWSAPWGWPGSP
ncbi:FAD-binding protein, partial [Micromonospora sp. STR1s_5]|nr:FAD-binding protein [Micromonospora sp. STR1s_5]